ncbi:putative nuclease HARBI1 [Capsella rubella]|uniref:putative nuclease HARBI1 n=1 Tax=Capsella rubella TaxID=81985 RepID=UPI000CD542EA|nr:putative nuclease HARBI1 [Capsella rubella]
MPKKRAYIHRNREEGHNNLWNDYFSDTPTYPPNLFRRRFRMNKPLFMRIVHRLSTEVQYFQQTEDAAGRASLSPIQKCTAAIRQLAYGGACDSVDEYIRIGASTARKCLHEFTTAIIQLFGDEYLRRPTEEDLQRLLQQNEQRGFPGMIGSIDCMHWGWKNCPTAWKGMYSRSTGKPTIVLEAVASYDLWIWHAFFGAPGTMNDLNILDRSNVFDYIINGQAPEVNFFVNGNQHNLAYYLTDGIYPKWATFIQSIRLPQGMKNSLFSKKQEAVRKDVERAFGVLQARFAVIKNPSSLWDKNKMANVMKACIILHNMIVEDERHTYNLRNASEFQHGEDVDQTYTVGTAGVGSNIGTTITRRTRVRDKQAHEQLKGDLIEHIWSTFGHLPYNED